MGETIEKIHTKIKIDSKELNKKLTNFLEERNSTNLEALIRFIHVTAYFLDYFDYRLSQNIEIDDDFKNFLKNTHYKIHDDLHFIMEVNTFVKEFIAENGEIIKE
jgi:uncharacterized membrane protein YgaE (UPF0421/DUF939 family)